VKIDEYDKIKIRIAAFVSFGFVVLLWLVKAFESYSGISLYKFGTYPREISGLIGIIASPFIHDDYEHLMSNSIPLLILTFSMFYIYLKSTVKVFAGVWLLSEILVWIFARSSYHIGASGLVYGFASYIFFMGLLRKDKGSIALALLVVFLYGSLVWGIFPTSREISFESHLAGAVFGLIFAVIFRKSEPVKQYDWEKEEEEQDENYKDEEDENVYVEEDADEVDFFEDEYYDEELERIKKGKKRKK
jgi:membrane associated rhomboid family serine protease